jgi:hypothetical protein
MISPGKWVVKPNPDGKGGWCVVPPSGLAVADCVELDEARLLAAAPELLRALKSLVADHGGTRAVHSTDMRAIAAVNAINRAEGQSYEYAGIKAGRPDQTR